MEEREREMRQRKKERKKVNSVVLTVCLLVQIQSYKFYLYHLTKILSKPILIEYFKYIHLTNLLQDFDTMIINIYNIEYYYYNNNYIYILCVIHTNWAVDIYV